MFSLSLSFLSYYRWINPFVQYIVRLERAQNCWLHKFVEKRHYSLRCCATHKRRVSTSDIFINDLLLCPTHPPHLPLVLSGMCNVRFEMTLTPAASCSPELNHSHTWASNIIFVSFRDAPYVQSVIGTLFPLQRRLKVGTGGGRWVRLLVWVWAGEWGVKGDVFGLSPHADSTWFSLADLMTPPGCRAAVWHTGVRAMIVWTVLVSWLSWCPPFLVMRWWWCYKYFVWVSHA